MMKNVVVILVSSVTIMLGCDLLGPTGPTGPTDPTDTIAPGNVSALEAVAGDGRVQLSWMNPGDLDFSHVVLSYFVAGDVDFFIAGGTDRVIVAGLPNGVSQTFILYTLDLEGNQSSGRSVDATPRVRAPSPVTGVLGAAGNAFASLTWSDPIGVTDLSHIQITHNHEGGGTPIIVAPGTGTVTVAGLTNGLSHEFTIIAINHVGNASTVEKVTITPTGDFDTTAPADVTPGAVAEGDSYVVLQWTDPDDSDLNHIQITHNQAGGADPFYVTAGSQQAAITDLANGTHYTFTIVAVDSSGNASDGVEVSGTPSFEGDDIALTVALVTPTDETILFTGDLAELNRSMYDQMTVRTDVTDATSYTWYLDGAVVGTSANEVEIASESLAVSVHELVLVLETGGVLYSAGLQFTVVEN